MCSPRARSLLKGLIRSSSPVSRTRRWRSSTYDDLIDAEVAGLLEVDGVLVVNADANGKLHVQKMTDHSTRTGLKWGIVGGVVAAVFLPATIVAGAVALGVAGAAAGKARNLYHRVEVEKELAGVITPGTSGILALVSALDADAVAQKMPKAEQVKTVPVDEETAGDIKAAATAAARDDRDPSREFAVRRTRLAM